MPTLLVRHAHVLVTMDGARREIADGGFLSRDGWIEAVGPSSSLPSDADEILDLHDHVVLPGLINTHHHLYQTLTRVVPQAQDADLFRWLKTLYPIWARIQPEDIRLSTQLGLAELALSGCTATADHLYLFPNGCRLDDEIEAARAVGLRLHASRGSMSLGESDGGLPPDSVVESPAAILADSQRLLETHHDSRPGAMTRIVVAPCSPFSVTPELMRESAALARSHGVRLHTHLAETLDEERFCLETFGQRPLAYAEALDWAGPDVWFAHAVHLQDEEIRRLQRGGMGVAHCPSSNMRLASGIAPVRRYLAASVKVGLGVDGSASNDSSHLLAEARQALLLSRLGGAARPDLDGLPGMLTARQALELATRGGAAVLGREDLGSLESGKCADFVAIDLNRLDYAGALHDPVAAVVLCSPVAVDHSYVHGRAVVRKGRVAGLDLERLTSEHNRAARRLVIGDS
ncbi:MAG: 8-oxoguanine deaminase [Gammaproteobacteria bacterium RBG_16_66_13]|nr:MAG: 8-oxoguanine deaminase [Gammaproteobacteria bacterium RBG_16_66_13]